MAVAKAALCGVWTKVIKPMTFNKLKGLFKYRFIGSSNVHLIPDSFKKAAIDPVKVIPPMTVPKYAAIKCNVVWSTVLQCDPNDVTTAANPTNAWNAATVCGSSVTATLFPNNKPAVPPAVSNTNAWVSKGAGKFNAHNAVTIPVLTPIIPNALPTLEDACDDSPVIPPMQHNDAAR